MKKFTRNFLLGELSLWRFLRKIGLGLVMVFLTTLVFAQEAQETYHLKAASWDGCYLIDNVYSVPVTMKDFIKFKSFEMELKYSNTTDFEFIGVSGVRSEISTMTVQEPTKGTLKFSWANANEVSILPDNEFHVVFNLRFKITSFQHQYQMANQFEFASTLKWTNVSIFNQAGQCEILTSQIENGGIKVTEKWQNVVIDAAVGDCYGGTVTAKVTTPAHTAGMLYSFNGKTFQPSNQSDVTAPSTNNVLVIKDANCISYIAKFDVDAVKPLEWTAASPVYTLCPGGLGDIEIVAKNGTKPYKYYVIPENQWTAGDKMAEKLENIPANLPDLLQKYQYDNYVIQVPAGTVEAPKKYWVAVQDANDCATISGTEFLSGWKEVSVIDNKDPWDVTTLPQTELVTTCYGQDDGRIVFEVHGGTPFTNGYNIALNGMYVGRGWKYDSNVDTPCMGCSVSHAVLAPGKYTYTITDANGCTFTKEYTVTSPKKIEFDIAHTDAGCDQPVGELWVVEGSAKGGTGPVSAWKWHYSTDPTFATDVSPWFPIGHKVSNLPAGVYYIEMEDANGCLQVWTNENGDDAIKVLTTVFDLVYKPIACFGGTTTVEVVLVSGDGNHDFEYKAEKWNYFRYRWEAVGEGTWKTSNKFANLSSGMYRFWVKDLTAQGCEVSWITNIIDPLPLQAVALTASTRPPSCPGNNDGNISIQAWGGRPWGGPFGNVYKFWIDDRPAKFASSISDFAVGAGTYNITIEDSAGCTTVVKVNIPDGENRINFQDKIYVQCANDSVNLFNAEAYYPWTWWKQVGLDKGYLLDYQWYPYINHTGDDQEGWFWEYWTSGSDWVQVPVQGNIYSRNPKLYISSQPWETKADIVANGEVVEHDSKFAAGTYYLVAKDEWGCYSNVEEIQIIEPNPLDIVVTSIDATCADTWTGEISVQAWNGNYFLPYSNNARYQYVLYNQPDIFNHPNWYGTQVTWIDFNNKNDWRNDSVATIAVQRGTYWLAVRDYCAIHDPSQIRIVGPIVIDGLDPITASVDVSHVSCYDGIDGSISVVGAGGAGGYQYELALARVSKPNPLKGWPLKNKTGEFGNLAAGLYTLTVRDAHGCTPYVKTIEVTQPDLLTLELQKVDASCFGAQDGIIRYIITGGTQPYKESTNNGLNWYEIPANKLPVTVFDRRAGAGTYTVMIMDAHGCETEAEIVIDQPAKLGVKDIKITDVSCAPEQVKNCTSTPNVVNDGIIELTVTGGWNAADAFLYTVTASKGSDVKTATLDKAGKVTFSGLTSGEWTIKLHEHAAAWYPKPYIMNPDYATAYAAGFPNSKQNPDVTSCFFTTKVTVGAPKPIAYKVDFDDVLCYNTESGTIKVYDVTGGTAKYYFMLQGPAGYAGNGKWVPASPGATEYTFKELPWGHYNVFVKDSHGCVWCQEAGEINNMPEMKLKVELVDNALCYNTPTGKIHLNATGGVPPYKYAIALASDVDKDLFPNDDPVFLNSLTWQTSPDFDVPAGEWIGYVLDSRCPTAVGHATDINGKVIMEHRVTVLEPTPVVGSVSSGLTMAEGLVSCFGEATGKIKVLSVAGGNGPAWSARVYGVDYSGDPVDKLYANVKVGGWLDGLKASTNKTKDIPDAEKYSVVFYDSEGCASEPVLVAVMQPVEFAIELYVTQDAFICPDDLAGVFEIRILSGGVTPVQYRYEAWDGTTKKLDSPWGAVNTFQGPAGLLYKVWAKDANGCIANVEKFIAKPAEIQFVSIDNLTCFGAATATARITVTGEPGRTYTLYHQKFPLTNWTKVEGSFTDEIVVTGLSFGDGSEKEGHYLFRVIDNLGCEKTSKQVTFVPVQQGVQLEVCCIEELECTGYATISVSGGTQPYVVKVDGEVVNITKDGSFKLLFPAGTHEVTLTDAHGCVANTSFTINAQPVTRTAEFHAYKWEEAVVTDAEAGIEEVLPAGVHTFKYDYNGCERTLVVTVIDDLARTAAIDEIQGMGDESPMVDLYRQITGTVTGAVPGVGYYVQDANAPWSGIWVSDPELIVVEGNGVKVEGVIAEVSSVTTLIAAKSSVVNPPLKINAIGVDSPQDAKDEKYESVLVTVEGARFMGKPYPDGSWLIFTEEGNQIIVNNLMYAYTPKDGHYYTVTGVVNGAHDLYKLEPRKLEDVIDLTQSTPVQPQSKLDFKVYPNPFNDVINIDNADRLTRVTVTNIAGQRVIDVQSPERVVSTSNLVSGVYVVTLFNETGIVKSERVVKR